MVVGKATGTPAPAVMPNVDVLLGMKKADIAALREALKDVRLPADHDDIRLLRYVMSYPKTHVAADQVRKAIQFRKENADWLAGAWTGGEAPYAVELEKLCKMGIHGETEGLLYLYMRSGKAVRSLKEVPGKDLGPLCERAAKFLTFMKEAIFARCDEMTRQTRVLTKFVNVHTDMSEFPCWANMTFIKMFKETSYHSTFLHPQLMHKQVVLDPPRVFFYVWKIAKPILPRKTVERMMFCQSHEFLNTVMSGVDRGIVPSIAGGSCKCLAEDGCLSSGRISTGA